MSERQLGLWDTSSLTNISMQGLDTSACVSEAVCLARADLAQRCPYALLRRRQRCAFHRWQGVSSVHRKPDTADGVAETAMSGTTSMLTMN